jgi:hypothetical protein
VCQTPSELSVAVIEGNSGQKFFSTLSLSPVGDGSDHAIHWLWAYRRPIMLLGFCRVLELLPFLAIFIMPDSCYPAQYVLD